MYVCMYVCMYIYIYIYIYIWPSCRRGGVVEVAVECSLPWLETRLAQNSLNYLHIA